MAMTNKFSLEREANRLFETYRKQIDLLDRSLLAHTRPITSYDVYALGKQLEAFNDYKMLCEADGNAAQLGRIPDIALDVITISFGSNILPVVASVQNIDEANGLVYFKQVKATQKRGNMEVGENILDPRVMTKTPQGYASNQITSEQVAEITSTVAEGSMEQVSATLSAKPVLAQSVKLFIENDPQHFAIDDGAGHILGMGITGTVNYETGAIALNVVGKVDANAKVTATYQTNLETAENIAQVQSEFATKQIKARVYALKSTIGLLQAYSMQKRFGMIAEDESAKDLISEINAELGGDLVRVLNQNSPNKNNPLLWDRKAPAGVSVFEHRLSFMDALAMMDKNIATTAGRGNANIYIAGATVCAVIQNLPNFNLITDSTNIGPHVFGTLNGRTVIRVVDNDVLPTNRILGVYKGMSPFEASCVYCPYMPLVLTSTLPSTVNPLQSQRAAAVWAGIDSLVPAFTSTMDMENSDTLFGNEVKVQS